MSELYVPNDDDRDLEAEEQMHMGKGPENALFDPWFSSAEEAETWEGEK